MSVVVPLGRKSNVSVSEDPPLFHVPPVPRHCTPVVNSSKMAGSPGSIPIGTVVEKIAPVIEFVVVSITNVDCLVFFVSQPAYSSEPVVSSPCATPEK